MMFEVCRSRALNKTNWFLLAFLHASHLALVNLEKAITKKELSKKTKTLCKGYVSLVIRGLCNKYGCI